MPKRNPPQRSSNQQIESVRWPKLFANLDRASSLVQNQGWADLLADLEALRLALEYDVIHNTPTMELTNFCRGQIAVLERLRDLPEELQEWKRSRR
jgi:hypothetical protein